MFQLKMIFDRSSQPAPDVQDLVDGFRLRTYRPEDEPAYMRLRECCGFNPESAQRDLVAAFANLRKNGFCLVEETATKQLVASAMARKGYFKNYDNLSWVMTHPDYRGHALGKIVVTAALQRSLDSHTAGMTLATDDFREPALRMYLKLGWRPWLYTEEDNMRKRWLEVAEKLQNPAAMEFLQF